MYELIPFENELVVLELNEKDYLGVIDYITKRGGEPFSGINITMDIDGNILNYSIPVNFNQGKTRKQEEKSSCWTEGKDTRRNSGRKQLRCKPLADPHFRIPACRHSHRAEFYFRNFSRRIQRCCGD